MVPSAERCRLRVQIAGFSVSRPASMTDADMALGRMLFQLPGQVGQFSFGFLDDHAVLIENTDSS